MFLFICFLQIKELIKNQALSFIPTEFKELKEKALYSARKRINQINIDEVILPNKPYIKEEFIGFVNNAFFAKTVSELKGYAISDEKKHLAIIVNRKTEIGNEMMKENSMFADKKTQSVYSLFLKYADDGEVAIYNITKIDEFQIFDRFQLTLPLNSNSFNSKCTKTGKNFGGRCTVKHNFNWIDDEDMPDKTTVKVDDFEADLYYGAKTRAEVSLIIKKTGAFNIQAEMDYSIDTNGGFGFYINKCNTSKYDHDIVDEKVIEVSSVGIPVFSLIMNLNANLVFQPVLNYFEVDVTKPVSLLKIFKLHVRSSLVVSTKHQKTSETEKEFHIESRLSNRETDFDDKFETEVKINGSVSIRAGIRAEMKFGGSTFSIEGGVKPFFDFTFSRNTTKCTAPAIFGHLVPTVNLYIRTKGEIKIKVIKIFKAYAEKLYKIISFDSKVGSCLYDDRNSEELDDQLIENNRNKPLNILLFDNFSSSTDGVFTIGNNLSNLNRFYNKYFILERENNVFNPDKAFLITNGKNNYTSLSSYITYNNNNIDDMKEYLNYSDAIDITDNLHHDMNIQLKDVKFDYSINSYKTRPVLYGKEFVINDISEFINSKPQGVSEFPYNLGLIYNVNRSYLAHYDDYSILNEYEDSLHEDLIDDVYQTSDYTGINISITLNDPTDTDYCKNQTSLRVFHTQDTDDVHLLYVTLFGCNNNTGEIKELFNPSLIAVPITETKGNVNCIRITYLNDSISLTRNDLIKFNNNIVVKTEHFTYNINVNYPQFPYYIFKLNQPKVQLKNQTAIAIVARFFQFRNQNVIPFDGIPQTITFRMAKNEVYGIYRGLFISHGENLSNLYALIYMPDLQPLTNDAQLIESDSYYIKLVENITLIKRKNSDDNSYDIIIPFRRRSLEKNDNLEITLYMVFQGEESLEKSDPYCSLFSTFSLKPNMNIFAGCIHNFSSNSWEHFIPSYIDDNDAIREQEISIPNSKYKLHCINFKRLPKSREIEDITVYATLKYVEFPSTSRFLIIENETASMLNTYCNGEYLQVICHRCNRIKIEKDDEEIEMIRSPYLDYLFMIMIDDSFNTSFPLVAYCDSNESAFCTFEMDISNDGYTLVEYNQNFTNFYIYKNQELFDETPGAEEVYQLNQYSATSNQSIDYYDLNMTSDQTRIDSGFKRQILHRNDVFLVTKPWFGPIKKTMSRMENKEIELTLNYHSIFENCVEISLHDDDDHDIPFSSKVFFQATDESGHSSFAQIGITFDSDKNDFVLAMNAEGHIVVQKSMFNDELIKKIEFGQKFDLVDLPPGCYSLKNGGSTDPKEKPKKSKKVELACTIVAAIIVLALVILVIVLCCKKKKKCCFKEKDDKSSKINLNDSLTSEIF